MAKQRGQVVGVLIEAGRAAAARSGPQAAQVRRDHAMLRRKCRNLVIPERTMERKGVDEENRLARTLVVVGDINAVDCCYLHDAAPCAMAWASSIAWDRRLTFFRKRTYRIASNASAAAAIVCATSASSCASETKAASNCDGARYTPRSSMAWKNRPKRAVSAYCLAVA